MAMSSPQGTGTFTPFHRRRNSSLHEPLRVDNTLAVGGRAYQNQQDPGSNNPYRIHENEEDDFGTSEIYDDHVPPTGQSGPAGQQPLPQNADYTASGRTFDFGRETKPLPRSPPARTLNELNYTPTSIGLSSAADPNAPPHPGATPGTGLTPSSPKASSDQSQSPGVEGIEFGEDGLPRSSHEQEYLVPLRFEFRSPAHSVGHPEEAHAPPPSRAVLTRDDGSGDQTSSFLTASSVSRSSSSRAGDHGTHTSRSASSASTSPTSTATNIGKHWSRSKLSLVSPTLPPPPGWFRIPGPKENFLLGCAVYTAVLSLFFVFHSLRLMAYQHDVESRIVIALHATALVFAGLGMYPAAILAAAGPRITRPESHSVTWRTLGWGVVAGGTGWIVASKAAIIGEMYLHCREFWPQRGDRFMEVVREVLKQQDGDLGSIITGVSRVAMDRNVLGDEISNRLDPVVKSERAWFTYGMVFFSLLVLCALIAEVGALSMWIGAMLEERAYLKQQSERRQHSFERKRNAEGFEDVDMV